MSPQVMVRSGFVRIAVLAVLAVWFAPPAPAFAPDEDDDRKERIARLEQRMFEHYQKKEYREAIKAGEGLLKLQPDDGRVLFNLGCLHCLAGETDRSYDYLERAVRNGFRDRGAFESDDDLSRLRGQERFRKLLDSLDAPARSPGRPAPPRERPPRTEGDEERAGREGRGAEVSPRKIEWHVSFPDGYESDRKLPLVVALHGRGANLRMATEDWEDAANEAGAILLTPQAPHEQGRDRFQWGSSVEEIDAVVTRCLEEVGKEYPFDGRRVVVAGFSQGAWAAYHLASRRPERFAGIVAVAGPFDSQAEELVGRADLEGLRVCILAGEDERNADRARRAAQAFKKAGAEVKLIELDGVGRGFPKNKSTELATALRFALGDGRKEAGSAREGDPDKKRGSDADDDEDDDEDEDDEEDEDDDEDDDD